MAYNVLQWIALISGILYVIFAARNLVVCWFFGIISCGSIAYVDIFTEVQLFSDALLQFIYILLGFYGIYQWMYGKNERSKSLLINSKGLRWHATYILIFSLLSFPFGKAMAWLFGGVFPLIDAWTTVLSVWATVLLTRRIIENWFYWIVLDLVYVVIYFLRDAQLFSVLFVVYTIVSIYGYFHWIKQKSIPAI